VAGTGACATLGPGAAKRFKLTWNYAGATFSKEALMGTRLVRATRWLGRRRRGRRRVRPTDPGGQRNHGGLGGQSQRGSRQRGRCVRARHDPDARHRDADRRRGLWGGLCLAVCQASLENRVVGHGSRMQKPHARQASDTVSRDAPSEANGRWGAAWAGPWASRLPAPGVSPNSRRRQTSCRSQARWSGGVQPRGRW
jgi:hypothetical protein